jgi:hypothetical protein
MASGSLAQEPRRRQVERRRFTKMLRLYFRTDRFRFYVNKGTSPAVAICANPRTYDRLS